MNPENDRNNPATYPARPARSRWTDEQWEAITRTDRSLLVSAAAGSGKTAVLSERCAYLVCDLPPEQRCEITELLIVTYTENAAAEMKQRIRQTLRDRFAAANSSVDNDPGVTAYLRRQLALAEQAHCSTIHAFCANLIRRNFHLLGVDPSFSILDPDDAALMRSETAAELFQRRYESENPARFESLVDCYFAGDDSSLQQAVIRAHEMTASLRDPLAWRTESCRRIAEAAKKLPGSTLGGELMKLIRRHIDDLGSRIHSASMAIDRLGSFEKYQERLVEYHELLESWQTRAEAQSLDELSKSLADLKLAALPAIRGEVANKQLAKDVMDGVKKQLVEGDLRQLLAFTRAEWELGLARTLPAAEEFLDLLDDFSAMYAQAKRRARAVDFSDLERMALKVLQHSAEDGSALSAPSPVAEACHRQFRYVLIDEFQDVNEVQDAILALASRECLHPPDPRDVRTPEPNLFCVGDVKQSIYRFRLAEPMLFLQKANAYCLAGSGHGRVIDLRSNFRSRGPLLESINLIFQRLMTADAAELTYDQSHQLHPGLVYPPAGDAGFSGAPIELHLVHPIASSSAASGEDGEDAMALESAQNEALVCAKLIRSMTGMSGGPRRVIYAKDPATGELAPRPVEFGDIVILLRSMKHKADAYADILRRADIPVHLAGGAGYFQSTEISDMLNVLRLLDNQRQDIPLTSVLRAPLLGIESAEDAMARIRLADGGDDPGAEPPAFHEAAQRYAEQRDDDLARRLGTFFSRIQQWRQIAQRRPLAELLWTIYEETGYLSFVAGLHSGEQRVANLLELHRRARQFGDFRRQGLYRFIKFIDELREQVDDVEQASPPSAARNAVRILSIHAAKGLEFPVVFVCDLGKSHNLRDLAGSILCDRAAFLGLKAVDPDRRVRYPSLAHVLAKDRIHRQAIAEELRVLYVALTRAREHLVLIGACPEKSAQRWEAQYNGHEGALPAAAIVGAGSMLEWLGAVWGATCSAAPAPLELVAHGDEQIAKWTQALQRRQAFSSAGADLAALRPLSPPPPPNAQADEIIARLSQQYAFLPLSQTAAVQPVTALTHAATAPSAPPSSAPPPPSTTTPATMAPIATAISPGEPASDADAPPLQPVEIDPVLKPPRFAVESTPTATDRGDITHRVMEYLDFAAPLTPENLNRQIDDLMDRRILTPAQAPLVDVAAIVWFFQSTDLGRQMRKNAGRIRNELAFCLPLPAPHSSDPDDAVTLRGRIDAIVELPDGLILVDYKTDRVDDQTLDARVQQYRPQLDAYRQALQRITGRRVLSGHLVFLTPRRVVNV